MPQFGRLSPTQKEKEEYIRFMNEAAFLKGVICEIHQVNTFETDMYQDREKEYLPSLVTYIHLDRYPSPRILRNLGWFTEDHRELLPIIAYIPIKVYKLCDTLEELIEYEAEYPNYSREGLKGRLVPITIQRGMIIRMEAETMLQPNTRYFRVVDTVEDELQGVFITCNLAPVRDPFRAEHQYEGKVATVEVGIESKIIVGRFRKSDYRGKVVVDSEGQEERDLEVSYDSSEEKLLIKLALEYNEEEEEYTADIDKNSLASIVGEVDVLTYFKAKIHKDYTSEDIMTSKDAGVYSFDGGIDPADTHDPNYQIIKKQRDYPAWRAY